MFELVEHEKVRFTDWNGEFACASLDFTESREKRFRTRRFYLVFEKIGFDTDENEHPKVLFLFFDSTSTKF